MPRPDYDTPLPPPVDRLLAEVMAMNYVGYAALGAGQALALRLAPGAASGTTSESNFYEELLVNPTLLKLATQRGDLDCGGLRYIALGYGRFIQFICNTKDGHLSVGISRKAPVEAFAAQVRELLERHGQLPTTVAEPVPARPGPNDRLQ